MVTESHTYHYSMTMNEQLNPNASFNTEYESWHGMAFAVNGGDDYASALYQKKGKKYGIPIVVTAHDFRLDIPENAYITRVRFEVCMRIDSAKVKVKAPNAYFMIYGANGTVNQQKTNGKDGWYGSTFRNYADAYLSTSWKTLTYTMSGTEWNKAKYPSKQLNNNIMGVDLHFNTPESMSVSSARVHLRWVRIIVDYDMPEYHLTYLDEDNSEDNPLIVNVGDEYCIKANFFNSTGSDGGTQLLYVTLPFGSVLKSFHSDYADITEYDAFKGEYLLECNGAGFASDNLTFCLESKAFGLKTLDIKHNEVDYPYYVFPEATSDTLFGELEITPSTIRQNKSSCFKFSANTRSNDDSITYGVTVDGDELTNWNNVANSVLTYYNNTNHGNNLVLWELEQSSQNQGVSIDWEHTNNNQITFNVPQNTDVNIDWTGCFVPLFDGANHIRVVNGDTSQTTTEPYNCLSAEPLEVKCTIDDTFWLDHRVLTQVTTDGFIVRCAVRNTDKVMVEGDCTLSVRRWEDVAYIGCIPLSRSHYEPSHDFTNKILSESYKNKTYKGKEGVFEDETDFKIRLPPKDWTTLQGLTKIDKPIPVNAVPRAFEGDVLNFRGWYEIGGIKGVTKTNPLYYDGEIELDPLTHNINTRFSIEKGNASNPYNLTSAMASVVESGDEFANRTYINEDGDIVSTSKGYFDIETDGVYIYDSDLEENLRTIITLDNAQSIKMVSKDTLNEQTEIKLEWNSSKISENKENLIERIIYITDDTGKPVFKYQYCNFEFDVSDEYYKCSVIASVINDGVETVVIEKELVLAVDVESLNLVGDGAGNIVQESEPAIDEISSEGEEEGVYAFNDYVYGSTLTFTLKNNVLKVIDSGFNGRGIVQDNIELPIANYLYELDFKNNNSDVETTEILSFFDFEVSEARETSDLANFYGNMFVTSFPVANKKILFTRQSQEGTIYYLADDGSNNFTYIQEPFYMYFCGVDLANHEGSSIFDLDNSYTTFYLQNGLVRLGLNRISGELYLSKYDVYSQEYINVSYLKATNTDFAITNYSDDRITIKAGTTSYTMYRGHPYVVINHPDEDLEIYNTINKVYADRINDDAYDYPIFFDLTNKDNLLPSCVGSSNVSIKCLDVSDEFVEETVTIPTITLSQLTSPIYTNELAYFGVTGAISSVSDNVPFEEPYYNGEFGLYSSDLLVDNSSVYRSGLYADNSIIQNGDLTTLRYRAIDFDGVGCNGLSVDFIQKNKHLFTYKGISGVTEKSRFVSQTGTNAVSVTVGANGTVLAPSSTSTGFIWAKKSTSNINVGDYYGDEQIVEFDVVALTGQPRFGFYESYGIPSSTSASVYLSQTGHIKAVREGTVIKYYVDDVLKNTYTDKVLREPLRLGFVLPQGTALTFKNFSIVGDEPVYPTENDFSDGGVTGNKNSNWTNYSDRLTVTTDANGTLLQSNTSTNVYYFLNNSAFVYDEWILDFDLVDIANLDVGVYIQDSGGANTYIYFNGSQVEVGSHIQVINKDNTFYIFANGKFVKSQAHSTTMGTHEIGFRLNSYATDKGRYIKYKNLLLRRIVDAPITDVNGIATINILGDGSGLETYYAKANNIVSNDVEVIDGIANINTNSSDITELQKANAVNIQLIGNKFDFTTTSESSGTYCGMYWNGQSSDLEYGAVKDTTIQDLQGKTLTCLIKDVVKGDDNWNLRVYQKINNGSWAEYLDSRLALSNGDNSTSFDVDENASHIWCRIEPSSTGTRHIQTGEWVVYPLESEEEPTPVEEILYENSAETSRTSKNGSTIYDNNMSVQLPTNAEITFDIYSNNSTSGSEHRFFLLPKTQYSSGTTQPTDAIYIDLLSSSKAQIGKRESNSTYYWVQNITATSSTYHTVKLVKTGTSIAFYLDDTLLTTQTVSWIDNYSDYCLSMMRWSASGTSSIKNVTIKKV